MSKSDLITQLAAIPENDPRLERIENALAAETTKPTQQHTLLLSKAEFVKRSGLSRSTVWRMVRDKEILTVAIREGSTRIPERELFRLGGAE